MGRGARSGGMSGSGPRKCEDLQDLETLQDLCSWRLNDSARQLKRARGAALGRLWSITNHCHQNSRRFRPARRLRVLAATGSTCLVCGALRRGGAAGCGGGGGAASPGEVCVLEERSVLLETQQLCTPVERGKHPSRSARTGKTQPMMPTTPRHRRARHQHAAATAAGPPPRPAPPPPPDTGGP